jgi:peroxiredoxin
MYGPSRVVPVALLALVLCASAALRADDAPTTREAASRSGVQVGDRAPNFNLRVIWPLTEGDEAKHTTRSSPRQLRLRDWLKGKDGPAPRLVLVDFWADYCKPCKRQARLLQRLLPRLRAQGVEVVAVLVEGGYEKPDHARRARAFAQEAGITFRMLQDPYLSDKVPARYLGDVQDLPGLFLVDGDGRVRAVHRGEMGERELLEMLEGAGR